MKNNWQLQRDTKNEEWIFEDYDDYGYGHDHPVSIGDEIESDYEEYVQYGIVIGIIRNFCGKAVCYKVWRQEDDSDGELDYIEASKVTLCEPCGSSEWSLGRVGYHFVSCDGGGYYYNEQTGDVIDRW